jgi:hypothetical protein
MLTTRHWTRHRSDAMHILDGQDFVDEILELDGLNAEEWYS